MLGPVEINDMSHWQNIHVSARGLMAINAATAVLEAGKSEIACSSLADA